MIAPALGCPSWRSLVRLSVEELGRCDIAAVNLACAEGLPGKGQFDIDYCLRRLDEWAITVRRSTERSMPVFRKSPEQYQNSSAYFRTLLMITVLQRDLGVRYNPATIPVDAPLSMADSFIHGILQGEGGTCGTLPVVYAAIGRRLGYPIQLASAMSKSVGHLFARWVDPKTGERFNIEGTNRGLNTPPDDYYRTGIYELPAGAEEAGCLLVSKTPKMELSGFLAQRAWCWEDVGNWRQCVESWAWTISLDPQNALAKNSLVRAMKLWDDSQRLRMPERFPQVIVGIQDRVYPELPLDVEVELLAFHATENLLSDPQLDTKFWSRMRQGNFVGCPSAVRALFQTSGDCDIRLQFA